MEPYFIIETSFGPVVRFNRPLLIVVRGNKENCKRFKTEKAAYDFITKYADQGYGLVFEECLVKEVK
jgi:hypothetical protein